MPTTATTPSTEDQLREQLAKAKSKNSGLQATVEQYMVDLGHAEDRATAVYEAQQRHTQKLQDLLVREHDDAGHSGPFAFCAAGLCRTMSGALDEGLGL